MRKEACLIALTMLLAPIVAAAQAPGQAQRSQPTAAEQALTLPPGSTSMRLDEGEQIRDTLGAILNSILTDDEFADVVDFESMVDHLAQPDRRRIGRVEAARLRQLTTTVRGIRDTWKQRYAGQSGLGEFNEDEVFRNVQIAEGRIADPATLAAHWPVTGRPADATTPKAVGTTGGFFEKNRDIAVVRLEAVGKQQPATVSLINERFDRWRVDIPDSITTAALLENLQRRLDAAHKASATWPGDRDGAHRYLANEVLMALNGIAPSQ